MMIHNSYYYIESALTSDQCQKIIDLGLSQIDNVKKAGGSTIATTFDGGHKEALEKLGEPVSPQADKTVEDLRKEKEKKSYIRDSEVSWLNHQWLYDLVYPFLHKANNDSGWKYQFDYSETFQFTKYGPNQFYGWHADGESCHHGKYKRYIPGITKTGPDGEMPKGYTTVPDMVGKIRKLSMTINLNKPGEYEGGNLKFDFGPHNQGKRFHECTEIRPQGSIIIFPSFVYHQVTPVTKGTRYSLVLWTLGRPFV